MTVISKELFYRTVQTNVNCKELHFWEENCLKASFSPYLVLSVAKGTAKFFFPIYVLKLLVNYKKLNDINFIKSVFVDEATAVLYGVIMANLLIGSICLLRKISRRVKYYNLGLFPGMISGLSLLVESKENQVLNTLIFVNSFLETVLRNIDFSLFKMTTTRKTLMFMVVSAVLMFLLENRKKKLNATYFWFYTPAKRKSGEKSKIKTECCSHPSLCWKFWREGFVKYFSLGYLASIIRRSLPRFGILIKKPQLIMSFLFNKSNIKLGMFIGGYVTTYRILTCYLLKWGKVRRKFHGLIAGFLSGLTYSISPATQILIAGITTILQIFYAHISDKFNIKNNFWPRQFLYMACHGMLFHMKIFYPEICSPYYRNMIDTCTSEVMVQVYETLLWKFFPEEIQSKHIFKYIKVA